METVARKKKSIIIFYAVLSVIGAAGMVLGIVLSCNLLSYDTESQFSIISIIVTGAVVAVVFAFFCLRIVFSPNQITYDGEKIDFGKGHVVNPSQIKNVEYHNSYFTQRTDVWGSLTVELKDVVIKYRCIDRVGEVCKRLIELKNNDLEREPSGLLQEYKF